jgi:hypothetical protein
MLGIWSSPPLFLSLSHTHSQLQRSVSACACISVPQKHGPTCTMLVSFMDIRHILVCLQREQGFHANPWRHQRVSAWCLTRHPFDDCADCQRTATRCSQGQTSGCCTTPEGIHINWRSLCKDRKAWTDAIDKVVEIHTSPRTGNV